MRFVSGLGVLIMLCTSAEAAPLRRARHPPERHLRFEQPVPPPTSITVPGWTDEETRQWLNSASGPKG